MPKKNENWTPNQKEISQDPYIYIWNKLKFVFFQGCLIFITQNY